jgi:spore coat polysaccharide biosynthesis protein SpsF
MPQRPDAATMRRDFVVVIQARMSSARFPGKVLAPLSGIPVLARVVNAVAAAARRTDILVATSDQQSDDPIAAYAPTLGVGVVRGPLEDVLERFRMCARQRGVAWIGRVSADSPMLDPDVLGRVLEARHDGTVDVVTTVFPRTFPAGQNVEVIRASTLMQMPDAELTAHDREHVTTFLYRNPQRYSIRNIERVEPDGSGDGLAVDTLDDLRRLETFAPVRTT